MVLIVFMIVVVVSMPHEPLSCYDGDNAKHHANYYPHIIRILSRLLSGRPEYLMVQLRGHW